METKYPDKNADFKWESLYVVNDRTGTPRIAIHHNELVVPETGYTEQSFPCKFEGRDELEWVYITHSGFGVYGSDSEGEPIVTYTVPARDEQGRLGVYEVTVVLHGWDTGVGGFSVNGPEFFAAWWYMLRALLVVAVGVLLVIGALAAVLAAF